MDCHIVQFSSGLRFPVVDSLLERVNYVDNTDDKELDQVRDADPAMTQNPHCAKKIRGKCAQTREYFRDALPAL